MRWGGFFRQRGVVMGSTHANRGKESESCIIQMNEIYFAKGLAKIDQVPVPTVHMSHRTKQLKAMLKTAEFVATRQPSTVDFTGVSNGRSIAFDVKETKATRGLPAKNLKFHQWEYLQYYHGQGGNAFLVIVFKTDVKWDVFKMPILQLKSPKEVSLYSREHIEINGTYVHNWDYLNLL